MILITVFFIVLIINILPAFAPPTWIVLALTAFYYNFTTSSLILLAFLVALAATLGRLILATFSKKIVRTRFLSEKTRTNLDETKNKLKDKNFFTSTVFFLYAISPLPSGQFFLAYGLTDLPIKISAIPFFLGRFLSYTVWAFGSSKISDKVNIENLSASNFFGYSFIISQLFALILVYLFVKINWHKLIFEKKITFIKN